jgi:CO/xanthine dehydrogenase Mo-binding subunit
MTHERELPDGIVGSEHLGARVFLISAADAQGLADRLAIVLGEHMEESDEMHLTYNAMQSGWHQDPGTAGVRGRRSHTQLFFEYTALLVLRARSAARSNGRR